MSPGLSGTFLDPAGKSSWEPTWIPVVGLELDMEQQTGYKSGKEYVKAVYCHPVYLTYMQGIPSPGLCLLQDLALEGKSRESMSEKGENNPLQVMEWRRSAAAQTHTGS